MSLHLTLNHVVILLCSKLNFQMKIPCILPCNRIYVDFEISPNLINKLKWKCSLMNGISTSVKTGESVRGIRGRNDVALICKQNAFKSSLVVPQSNIFREQKTNKKSEREMYILVKINLNFRIQI